MTRAYNERGWRVSCGSRLIAMVLFSAYFVGQQAYGNSPPPRVAVFVNGIGFFDIPEQNSTSCIRETCVISQQYDRVELKMTFPSDLGYSGAWCEFGKSEGVFDFYLTKRIVTTKHSIEFRFESSRCSGRYIDLNFVVRNWSDIGWVKANIVQASEAWSICISPTISSFRCSKEPIVTQVEGQTMYEAVSMWISHR